MPAPKTIRSSLHESVFNLLMKGKASELELKRLAVGAERLSSAGDIVGSVEIKASVAALSDQFDLADELYRRAIKVSGNDDRVLMRYLSVLAGTAQSLKLKSFCDAEVDLRGVSPYARAHVASLLGYSGWLLSSYEIRNKLDEAGHDIGDTEISELQYPSAAVDSLPGESREVELSMGLSSKYLLPFEVLEKYSIGEERVANLVEKVLDFLRRNEACASAVKGVAAPRDDGTSSLMVNFVVPKDSERASDLEWDLYGYLGTQDVDLLSDGVVSVGVISGCK